MLLGAQAATQQSHSMPTTTGPAHDGASPAAAVPSVAVPVEGDGGPTDSVRCPHAGTSGGASLGSPSLGSPSLGGPSLRRTPDASTIVPLREGRYKVQFTASQSLVDMFNEALDLFQNQLPTGDLASIVQRALVLLIAERKKQLFAQTNKPRVSRLAESNATADKAGATTHAVCAEAQPSKPNSRHIAHSFSEASADEARSTTRVVCPESEPTKSNTRRQPSKANTRHIAHALRRQVYARDVHERSGSHDRAHHGAERREKTMAFSSGTPVNSRTISLSPGHPRKSSSSDLND